MTLKNDETWKPVITTRPIIEGRDTIVIVDLDEESDWSMLGDEEPDEEEMEVVSAEEMLRLDPTLSTLPDLHPGQTAERDDAQSPWRVVKYDL